MKIKQAFTMAEAILVMTILGIIATIMITTLKPAEFKDKGMKILAKKVLSEIDTATTQILINNSLDGTMTALYQPGTATTYAFSSNATHNATLYKKYLTATRQTTTTEDCAQTGYNVSFFLKDGACMAIKTGAQTNTPTIFPGEKTTTNASPKQGLIFFDINGSEEPNVEGKDRFILPVGDDGIDYAI